MNTNLPNYMTRTMLSEDLRSANVNTVVADKQLESQGQNYEFPFNTLNSIEGIPYQFMDSVDRRVSSNGQTFGRKYSQKILSQLPLLFMMPCRPKFMPGYDKASKESVIMDLVEQSAEFISGQFMKAKIGGMYYSVEFAYEEYYNYLNKMIQSIAGYMGLGDERINLTGRGAAKRVAIRDINWATINNFQANNNVFNSNQSLAFFVDGLNSIDTSFSNDTRASSIAGTVNGYSEYANEIYYLLGRDEGVGKLLGGATDITSAISGAATSLLNGVAGGMVDSLGKTGVGTILDGGKIIFPEIWSDSEHSESYSFTIKLRSPDHDSLSILLNVLVPYCKILAMTMPKTIDGNPNGYSSPFLVKAYCKGLFSIDMGMIDSLQVTKGAECMWNDDGLPTQIDISFSIKNLYNNLAMSSQNDKLKYLFCNTAYMDFLANMAGCNVMQENYTSSGIIDKSLYQIRNRIDISQAGGRLYNRLSNSISNTIGRVYGAIK